MSSGVFIAEDIDGVGDRVQEIPQWLMYRQSRRPTGTCHRTLPVVLMKPFLVKSKTSCLGNSLKCWIIRISELLDAGLKACTVILNKCDKFGCNMSMKIH